MCFISCTTSGGALRVSTTAGEPDDGDYATLRGPNGDLLHLSHHITEEYLCNDHADDTSEEGKLLECVRDDSVTYASTRDLEPPMSSATMSPANSYITSPEHMMSPLAPVSVTVHSNEIHVSSDLLMIFFRVLSFFFCDILDEFCYTSSHPESGFRYAS